MARVVFAVLFAAMAFVLPGFDGSGAVADHTAYHDDDDDTITEGISADAEESYDDLVEGLEEDERAREQRDQEDRIRKLEGAALREGISDVMGGNQPNAGYLPPPIALSEEDFVNGQPLAFPPEHTFYMTCGSRDLARPDEYGDVRTISACMLVQPVAVPAGSAQQAQEAAPTPERVVLKEIPTATAPAEEGADG